MEFSRHDDPRKDWPELYLEMLQADFVLVQGRIFVVPGGETEEWQKHLEEQYADHPPDHSAEATDNEQMVDFLGDRNDPRDRYEKNRALADALVAAWRERFRARFPDVAATIYVHNQYWLYRDGETGEILEEYISPTIHVWVSEEDADAAWRVAEASRDRVWVCGAGGSMNAADFLTVEQALHLMDLPEGDAEKRRFLDRHYPDGGADASHFDLGEFDDEDEDETFEEGSAAFERVTEQARQLIEKRVAEVEGREDWEGE